MYTRPEIAEKSSVGLGSRSDFAILAVLHSLPEMQASDLSHCPVV